MFSGRGDILWLDEISDLVSFTISHTARKAAKRDRHEGEEHNRTWRKVFIHVSSDNQGFGDFSELL